MDTGTL
jgi:hypothetical protein